MNGQVTLLALLTAAFLSGCRTPTDGPEGSRDHLVDWYKASSPRIDGTGETLIPVLKIDGTYYTTFRWVEVPMRECAEGLIWDDGRESPLLSLLIGYSSESNTYYGRASHRDRYTDYSQPDMEHWGKESLELTRVDKPKWVLPAPPPRTNDDFVGCFQFVWFPPFGIRIRKEGEKYLLSKFDFGRSDKWEELAPRPNGLGVLDSIVYSENLLRFEMVSTKETEDGAVTYRVPLSRVPAAPTELPSEPDRWIGYPFPGD